MRRLVVWLSIGLLWSSGSAEAQWQKNEYQLQREAASRYEPAPIIINYRARGGAPTVMRVRFYCDEGYRASTGVSWQDRVRAQLGQLNQLLEPAFGVRLQAESFKHWQRGGPGGALLPMLQELERLDPGADVDWVVGLVAPLPLVSMSFHDLGWATLLGRHFVLRSMSSIAELDDFNRMFKALDRQQREVLYSRRKAHKELAIFLHEWAHTLGAVHVSDARRIMAEAYSHESSALHQSDAGLVAAGLEARLSSRGRNQVDWTPLKEFLSQHQPSDWLAGDRASLDRMLGEAVRPASPGATAPPVAARPAPAASAKPGEPAFVTEARGHLGANRRGDALAVAHRAAARARDSADDNIWVTIARLYGEIGALAHADQALEHAGAAAGAPAAGAEILQLRRSYGLPRASGGKAGRPRNDGLQLPPDGEPDYVAAVLRMRSLLTSNQIGPAREAVLQELRRFPGAPGMLVLSCEASLLGNRARDAAASCAQALKAMEDLPRAHYLTGLLRANTGRTDDAIKSLRRAIELAPDQRAFWNALGDVYRASGRGREFRALLADQEKAGSAAVTAAPGSETIATPPAARPR